MSSDKSIRSRRYLEVLLFAFIVTGGLGLDWFSKRQIEGVLVTWVHPSDPHDVRSRVVPLFTIGTLGTNDGFSSYLSSRLVYVRSFGSAWGLLTMLEASYGEPLYYLFILLALAFLFNLLRIIPRHHSFGRYGTILVLTGTIGNAVDHMRFGFAIDWIELAGVLWSWPFVLPSFNLADIYVCTGVAILIIDLIVLDIDRRRQRARR